MCVCDFGMTVLSVVKESSSESELEEEAEEFASEEILRGIGVEERGMEVWDILQEIEAVNQNFR